MKVKNFSQWRLGDYFRQLSIVILGIVITFMAGDAINKYTKSKEIKKSMQLVRDELELNRENVGKIADWIKLNQRVGWMILQADKNLEQIPVDTLQKYINLPFQTEDFLYTDHALELLKTSSLFQQVRDKEHALQLIKAYAELELVARQVDFFMTEKAKRMEEFEEAIRIRHRKGDGMMKKAQNLRESWALNLTYVEFQNIFYFVLGCFDDTEAHFQNVDNKLLATIKMLDKEYGTSK